MLPQIKQRMQGKLHLASRRSDTRKEFHPRLQFRPFGMSRNHPAGTVGFKQRKITICAGRPVHKTFGASGFLIPHIFHSLYIP